MGGMGCRPEFKTQNSKLKIQNFPTSSTFPSSLLHHPLLHHSVTPLQSGHPPSPCHPWGWMAHTSRLRLARLVP